MRRGGTVSGWLARIKTWRRSRRQESAAGYPASSYPTSGSGDVFRSKRLGALLYLYRGGHSDPLRFRDELHPDELDCLADISEDDMHLVNACLEVEAWMLKQEWAAADRLLAGGMFGADEADAKLDEAMEHDNLGRIAGEVVALMELGWLD